MTVKQFPRWNGKKLGLYKRLLCLGSNSTQLASSDLVHKLEVCCLRRWSLGPGLARQVFQLVKRGRTVFDVGLISASQQVRLTPQTSSRFSSRTEQPKPPTSFSPSCPPLLPSPRLPADVCSVAGRSTAPLQPQPALLFLLQHDLLLCVSRHLSLRTLSLFSPSLFPPQ